MLPTCELKQQDNRVRFPTAAEYFLQSVHIGTVGKPSLLSSECREICLGGLSCQGLRTDEVNDFNQFT
jgi:hypothetical protein